MSLHSKSDRLAEEVQKLIDDSIISAGYQSAIKAAEDRKKLASRALISAQQRVNARIEYVLSKYSEEVCAVLREAIDEGLLENHYICEYRAIMSREKQDDNLLSSADAFLRRSQQKRKLIEEKINAVKSMI